MTSLNDRQNFALNFLDAIEDLTPAVQDLLIDKVAEPSDFLLAFIAKLPKFTPEIQEKLIHKLLDTPQLKSKPKPFEYDGCLITKISEEDFSLLTPEQKDLYIEGERIRNKVYPEN